MTLEPVIPLAIQRTIKVSFRNEDTFFVTLVPQYKVGIPM